MPQTKRKQPTRSSSRLPSTCQPSSDLLTSTSATSSSRPALASPSPQTKIRRVLEPITPSPPPTAVPSGVHDVDALVDPRGDARLTVPSQPTSPSPASSGRSDYSRYLSRVLISQLQTRASRSALHPPSLGSPAPPIPDEHSAHLHVYGSAQLKAHTDLSLRTTPQAYIGRHPGMTPGMRGILVDWLYELHLEYKLAPSTLYLSCRLVDRSLAEMSAVPRSSLQCLGCACMLIASKIEEVHPPTADDFVYISDGTYTRQQITDMESSVCSALGFSLQSATMETFRFPYLRAAGAGGPQDARLGRLVGYLTDLALLSYELAATPPHVLTAAAVYMGMVALRYPRVEAGRGQGSVWTETLRHYTGLAPEDLADSVRQMHRLWYYAGEGKLKTVFGVYKDDAVTVVGDAEEYGL